MGRAGADWGLVEDGEGLVSLASRQKQNWEKATRNWPLVVADFATETLRPKCSLFASTIVGSFRFRNRAKTRAPSLPIAHQMNHELLGNHNIS